MNPVTRVISPLRRLRTIVFRYKNRAPLAICFVSLSSAEQAVSTRFIEHECVYTLREALMKEYVYTTAHQPIH